MNLGKARRAFLRLFRPTASVNVNPPPHPLLSKDDIRQFLPSFLSQGSHAAFIDEIKQFSRSQAKPFYSLALADKEMLFQGDGVRGFLIVRLPDPTMKPGPAMLLSNTCDVDPANKRLFDASLTYAPIFSLPRYLASLRDRFPDDPRLAQHESDVRQQLITQIFFLPKGGELLDDSLVFLDRIISASSNTVNRATVPQNRLFTLSDFGAWLLALKLSIHFCRIRDHVDRNAGTIA
jgi:hypothetical protein